MDFSYSRLKSILNNKFTGKPWLNEALSYLISRCHPIENRIVDTYRYVECDAANASTYSYEFGSILRDIGSTFGSVLDNLVRNSRNEPSDKRYNMSDYRLWLNKEVNDLHLITVGISVLRQDKYVIPFSSWERLD